MQALAGNMMTQELVSVIVTADDAEKRDLKKR
jgi:hypothetical protein